MVAQITVAELAERLRQGQPVRLLDVRQPAENEIVALPNSLLIPLGELAHRHDEIPAPDGVPLVVYCHHGIRSLNAAYLLEQLGFADVFSLAGGIDAWSRHIDPTVPRY